MGTSDVNCYTASADGRFARCSRCRVATYCKKYATAVNLATTATHTFSQDRHRLWREPRPYETLDSDTLFRYKNPM